MLMSFVARVLVLEILDWQTLDFVRLVASLFFNLLANVQIVLSSIYIHASSFYFFQVLIDESTQATEPECLIPLVLGVKQVMEVDIFISVDLFIFKCWCLSSTF